MEKAYETNNSADAIQKEKANVKKKAKSRSKSRKARLSSLDSKGEGVSGTTKSKERDSTYVTNNSHVYTFEGIVRSPK